MKIIILLFALALALGVALKNSASDMKEISIRKELNSYRHHSNLLPAVEVVAPRS